MLYLKSQIERQRNEKLIGKFRTQFPQYFSNNLQEINKIQSKYKAFQNFENYLRSNPDMQKLSLFSKNQQSTFEQMADPEHQRVDVDSIQKQIKDLQAQNHKINLQNKDMKK